MVKLKASLDLYRMFYTAASSKNLSKAAEELFISQPAISQAIKQLEAQLGMPLFNRTRRGVELTAQAGEMVFKDVEKALKILNGIENKLTDLKESATGTIRIGASASIFQYVLSSKIVEYRNRYPKVNIELISDVSPKIIEYLKADRCDIGFLNLPIEDDEEIQLGEPIQILHDVFVVGKAYESLAGFELSLSDLKECSLLLMKEQTVARDSFEIFCRNFGVKLAPSVEVDSWDFMKRLVTDGMGIGCIPREYVKRRLAEGLLFELNVQPTMPLRSIGMALPTNSNMPYALRAFINLFERERND
ncbi:MAG: LysR family transcriptional regulator [Clostridia bacterium]|nr:LysR family transcriptional regulator [Clostridia bacterium]